MQTKRSLPFVNVGDKSRWVAIGLCLLMPLALTAETITISGGNWSSAGVTSGSDVVVTGETVNDVPGLVLNSLTLSGGVSGAVSIGGTEAVAVTGPITIGDAEDEVQPDAASYSCDVPIAAAGANSWRIYGTNTVFTLNASYDFGEYGCSFDAGSGSVHFKADNYGSGGVTLSSCNVYLYGKKCGMGSSACTITTTVKTAQLYLAGTTLSNGLVQATYVNNSGDNTSNSPVQMVANTENVILGQLGFGTVKNPKLGLVSDSRMIATKGIVAQNCTRVWPTYLSGSYSAYPGTLVITNTPWGNGTYGFGGQDCQYGCGHLVLSVASNKFSYVNIGYYKSATLYSTLEMTVDWALNATEKGNYFRSRYASSKYTSAGGSIILRGTKQRFGGFFHNMESSVGSISGDPGSVLYCNQYAQWSGVDGVPTVAHNFTGAVTFVKEGKLGLTLSSKSSSTTTGDLKVSEGTLNLTSAAKFTKIANVVVGRDAADDETIVSEEAVTPLLTLAAAANVNAAAKLRINGAGVVAVAASVEVEVDELYLDGELMPAGTYGASVCPSAVPESDRAAVMAHFTGEGSVTAANGKSVVVIETEWTGLGDGTSWKNPENWSNGCPRNGADVKIDLAAGEVRTMNNDCDSAVINSLSITGAGSVTIGGGLLRLGAGGLTVGTAGDDTTAATNEITCTIELVDTQVWTVNGALRELVIRGNVGAQAPYGLTRSGNGKLRLYGDNAGFGMVTLEATAGATYAYSQNCALGEDRLVIEDGTAAGNALYLCGTVLSNEFCTVNGSWGIFCVAGTANEIAGELVLKASSSRLTIPKTASLTVSSIDAAGGTVGCVTAYSTNPWNCVDVGHLTVRSGFSAKSLGSDSASGGIGDVTLGGPGSTLTGSINWNKAKIVFADDWVLGDAEGTKTTGIGAFRERWTASGMLTNGGTVDFGSTKQRLGGFSHNTGGTLTGEVGSEFHCRQVESGITLGTKVTGELSFIKEGPENLTMTAVSTTTGTLGVEEGTLTLTDTASFANSTNVYVSGGVLSIGNPNAFKANPRIEVGAEGLLELNFAGSARIGDLYLNGARVCGKWGGPESDAENKSPFLSGTGTVMASGLGLLLSLR